ncbi:MULTISPECIES: glutamate ABC transporter substrate-binding protein [Nocardia]|uniref:glutamate ABC transporter substrate-binding protein n=1 Tax=Nocardia TaxID=1817 RepID=UPI0002EE42A0|nr:MULTISPECIES: glutamate ABC transporter substrate-binding protein [Nocardia]MBF6217735.1 glutamate ABC transporter substrate-binding protein [Nocardia abscessus]MBF6470649.1 glutamate ABC transporter substrate-binding protein [Nocardia abscessus]MCC3329988.1 glutamate ABC transporter substrate-binding protein [Nocardia abscessus]MDE1672839.1 glutamate ABC transporter substrate-binding protein [Nocardia gipuzkoensis]UGT66386.1 glutamate ABC transporter substrate-binding protein [Nocardia gip
MRINRALRIGVGAIALTLAAATATACGGGDDKSALDHAKDGKLTVGIKFDQPGLGLRNKDGSYSGFDVEVAKYVAGKLGVQPDQITFKEAPSPQRETLIENGQVDYIVATYSINDKRKEKIDFAGPYYVAGQSLLVRADNTDINGPDNLKGKKVCSVKGSTPAQNIEKNFPDTQLQTNDTYSLCLEGLRAGSWDAVTTDDIILAGYAAQSSGAFKVVGKPFTTENYGIGSKKGDKELRDKINDAIEAMIADGSWKKAFDSTVGASGYQAPQPPTVNRY